tara:strand:+ start:12587 stop:12874 length:288 start_codon:yes stop_codon:yes gene_type:complete
MFNKIGSGISRVFNSLLHTTRGQIILSIILGLGLATLFRRVCKGNDCFRFIGPEQNNLRDKIFKFNSDNENNDDCYILKEELVKCDNNKKTLEFA